MGFVNYIIELLKGLGIYCFNDCHWPLAALRRFDCFIKRRSLPFYRVIPLLLQQDFCP